MNKRRLIIGALLCVTLITQAATAKTLQVQAKDGTQNTYPLSSVQKITFSGSTMSVVKTDATKTDYVMSNVQNMQFSSATAIKEASNATLKAYPNPAQNVFNVEGISNVEHITLYNLTGNALPVSYHLVNNGVQINTSSLTQGLYLLRVNNQTLKFQKQ